MTTHEQKKEIVRVKEAIRNRQPERMAMKRLGSIKRSKMRKLETTGKRFQEHTIDELLSIARQKCIDGHIDWDGNKQAIEYVLTILHMPQNVLSDVVAHNISTSAAPSSGSIDQVPTAS